MKRRPAQPIITAIGNSLWQVVAPWHVDTRTIRIVIQPFFVFNGASIPRLFWSLIGHPMSGRSLPAALAHDAMYATHLVTRHHADKLFYDLLCRSGVGKPKAVAMYLAVRAGAFFAWLSTDEEIAIARTYVKLEDPRPPKPGG